MLKERNYTPPRGIIRRIHEKMECLNSRVSKNYTENQRRAILANEDNYTPIQVLNATTEFTKTLGHTKLLDKAVTAMTDFSPWGNFAPQISLKIGYELDAKVRLEVKGRTLNCDVRLNPQNENSVRKLVDFMKSMENYQFSSKEVDDMNFTIRNIANNHSFVTINFGDTQWEAVSNSGFALNGEDIRNGGNVSYHELSGALR